MSADTNNSATPADAPLVLIACRRDAERVGLLRLCHEANLPADTHENTRTLLGRLTGVAARPLVLIVDPRTHGLDYVTLLRVVRRHPSTFATRVIALLDEGVNANSTASVRPFDTISRPLTCAAVLPVLRDALVDARAACDAVRPATPYRGRSLPVDDCDALLRRAVRCPCHEAHPPGRSIAFDRLLLRTGKLQSVVNGFDVPVYTGLARGRDFVDYNRLSVTVCPVCLFASNDATLFRDAGPSVDAETAGPPSSSGEAVPVALSREIVGRLTEDEARRRAIAGPLGADAFTHHRTEVDARVAWRLAIECGETLSLDPPRRPTELLRLANHHLRLHALNDPEPTACLAAAAERLAEAFTVLQGPMLGKAVVQLVAIHLALDDPSAAFRYVTALERVTLDPRTSAADLPALRRQLARGKTLWADRPREAA